MNTATQPQTIARMNTTTQPRLVPLEKVSATTSVVPKGATLKGQMEASTDLDIRIDGSYTGKIELKTGSTIHICAGAVVECEGLAADYIYIEGQVKGNVHARKGIEISASGRVKGSVRYDKDLDIHPGSRISGQLIGPDGEE